MHRVHGIPVFVLALLVVGCQTYPNTPDGVVRKMYDAIQEENHSKYLDAISPNCRSLPGYLFWIQSLRIAALAAGHPLPDNAGRLSFRNLKVELVDPAGTDATKSTVRTRGAVRVESPGLELPLDLTEKTIKLDGTWYVYNDLCP